MLRSCLPNVYSEFDSYTLLFRNSWLNRFRIGFKGKRQWSICYTDNIIPPQAMQYNTIQCNATQRNATQFYSKQYNILTTPWWDKRKAQLCKLSIFFNHYSILPVWTSPKTGMLAITVGCLTAVSSFLFSDTIDSFVTNSGRNTCDALVWSFISSKCTSIRVRSLSTRPNPSILILPKGKVPVIY